MPKSNTIKEIAKKVAFNNNEDDYTHIPIGADSDNIDRPNGTTVEEGLENLESTKIEIIQVKSLPTENIKPFPVIYAVLETSNAALYEYKNKDWVPYGGKPDFVGTEEELLIAIEEGAVTDGMTVYILDSNGSESGSSGNGSGSGSLVTVKLDNELSETSENGVKNKTITLAINSINTRIDNLSSEGVIVLENELLETSENGVKNKVVANAINNLSNQTVKKTGCEMTGTLKVPTLILGTDPSDEIGAMWLELE